MELRPIRRLFALGPERLALFVRVVLAALVVEIFWRLGFRWLSRMLKQDPTAGMEDPVKIRQVAELVGPAYRLLHAEPTCLKRACALVLALRSLGIRSRLVLGANTEDGFRAHAWVAAAGTEYLRDADTTYEPVAVV